MPSAHVRGYVVKHLLNAKAALAVDQQLYVRTS